MKEIPKKLPVRADGSQMTEEEYKNILNARDSIMAFFMTKDFTIEDCEIVLDMVKSELGAIVKRSKIKDESEE